VKIITVTLAPNQAVLTCYLQDQSPKMPNAAIRPAMLVVPGGGYQYCSDREGEPVALAYMAQGFNAFVLRYTADATTPIDKALQDGAAAMDYLRANAAELEIDPQQIAAVGFSAGAHLAASTALLWDAAPVQQALGITGTEARPNAVVLGYPVITSGKFAHRGSFENLCGADEALLQTMSLENQVRPDVPPFFIWHTVEDQAVPVENSLLLAGALKENNVPFELHLFTHGGHGSSTCTNEVNTPNKHNNAWLPLCMGWLGETLDFTL